MEFATPTPVGVATQLPIGIRMLAPQYYAPELAAQSVTAQAYASLPGEMRELLWYLDVEHLSVEEVVTYSGLPPEAVRMASSVARARFRKAWASMQTKNPRVPPACAEFTRDAILFERHELPQAVRDSIDDHLVRCIRCAILAEEVHHLEEHLDASLLPLVVGPPIPDAH
ncbi:hypothetical protein [Timonella senegalensis]|uniref:hypothetical protein n=1 Tax=Timonella senegalensis TaxID=1465825 RepID=UPI0028A6B41D|nr:hypothetical protein [Timonella senegalensis]